MATYKFILFAGNERKDGSFPVSIRITKERKSKLIRTGLVSTKEQWNESDGRFVSVIESFMSEVKSSLERGDEVTLRSFGTFCLKHRAEKVARNLSLNTSMVIPEHDIPSFKPSTEFLKRLK